MWTKSRGGQRASISPGNLETRRPVVGAEGNVLGSGFGVEARLREEAGVFDSGVWPDD